MTENEYKLKCENEKLKKEIIQLKNKNKDLEIEKKTLKMKLKNANEYIEDLKKENKTIYYRNKCELKTQEINKLKKDIEKRDSIIENLKQSINKNSSNSSKPSSTDGFKKVIHNSRVKTGKKVGAQENHKYNAPKLNDKPNKINKVPTREVCTCGGCVKGEGEIIRRQSVRLEVKYYVTEYQGQKGICNKCGKTHWPQFPKNINHPLQYDNSVKSFSIMLSEYENVSVEKIKELIGTLTNTEGPAEGTIMKWKESLYEKTPKIIEDMKNELIKSEIANVDESPYNLNGKIKYVLGAFTKDISILECPNGRGKDAFEAMNILPRYTGIVVGDHYALNIGEQWETAFCNIHTIRTAKSVLDIRKDSMAKIYIEYMYKIKEEVESSTNNELTPKRYEEAKKEYTELLNKWKEEYCEFSKGKPSTYHQEERRLINLLLNSIDGHLMFAKKSIVPFTNNDAERGLRGIKSKIKVIGGFREQRYANGYCHSLSIIQTAKKQNKNPLEILEKIISGESKVFKFQTQ